MTVPDSRIATSPQSVRSVLPASPVRSAPPPLTLGPVINRRIVALSAAAALVFALGAVAVTAYLSKARRGTPVPAIAEADEAAAEQEPQLAAEVLPVPQPPAEQMAVLPGPSTTSPEPAEEPFGPEVPDAAPAAPPAAPMPPAVVMPPKEPVRMDKAVVVKRLHHFTDEDLRRQLIHVPELSLDRAPNSGARIVFLARQQQSQNPKQRQQPHVLPTLLTQRTDLIGLPMRMGAECQLGKEPAETLQALSRKLRTYIGASVPKDGTDPRPDPVVLREKLLEGEDAARREWQQAAAIPTLQQMLQAENTPSRRLLIELLAQIKDQSASTALAQRALFDLSAEVRTAAIEALSQRPRDESRAVLLDGFRYPWAPVADHAAEALVALGDRQAVPELRRLLDEPDPALPFQDKNRLTKVREMVRVNHLGNCLLCHAPSLDRTDLVRGRLPTPGQPLPPPTTTQYYEGDKGIFVRADVTYLKQDFSVPQPVEKPGPWPTMQRYDYLVRTRPATLDDTRKQPSAERLAAIRFALDRLRTN